MILYQLIAEGRDFLNNPKKIYSKRVFVNRDDALDYVLRFMWLVEATVPDKTFNENKRSGIIELELVDSKGDNE